MNIALFFGGNSLEHEVSLKSAAFVLTALLEAGHKVTPIAITKDGHWYCTDVEKQIQNIHTYNALDAHNLLEDEVYLVVQDGLYNKTNHQKLLIDCAFIMVHGNTGEDGILQTLLHSADITFTGCGIESSMLCMNKNLTKQMLLSKASHIPMLEYDIVHAQDISSYTLCSSLSYPVIVKPADGGSSVGVFEVYSQDELQNALKKCAQYTQSIMIEPLLLHVREIEIAITGSYKKTTAYNAGEIRVGTDGGVYTYDRKYNDTKHEVELMVPAHIPQEIEKQIQKYALEIYQTLMCNGFARVDFFLSKDKNNEYKIYFNEINTIPGCTEISLFPKAVLHSGKTKSELINLILDCAIKR